MDLQKRFIENWKKRFASLSITKQQYLVAVSGGMDSVVLVDLMYRSNMNFDLVHCNFQLRGAESERDEQFVVSLASQYQKKLHLKTFDTKKFAQENKISIQEAARKLRYDWFQELTNPEFQISGSSFLLTAHHSDDNIETFLMNVSRGTGLQGLTGIQGIQWERKIIRPLLFAFRKEIEDYAKENNIEWVEDSSNSKDDYTRNFFRHQILPLIQQQYSNAPANMVATIERLNEVNTLYQNAIIQQKEKLVLRNGMEVHIPILKLLRSNALQTIIWEIFKDYGFSSGQTNEILKLLQADNASYIQSHTHKVIKNRKWLIISPITAIQGSVIVIEKNNTTINFANGSLVFESLPNSHHIITDQNIATLDLATIQFPLILRRWKSGDYFYPLGMYKKKKLNRFLIDQKLSPTQKENIWVLECQKKIIWVIGYRIDNRCKILPSTTDCLKITYVNKR